MRLLTLSSILFLLGFSAQAENTLMSRQWGMKNTGQTLRIDDSLFTEKEIVGVPGVDIEWTDIEVPNHRKAIVAVIDRGVDIFHPDLKGRLWQNTKTCPELPDNDEEKIARACHGFNAFDKDGNVTDDDGHGTHIAGIIAANDNKIGIKGAAHKNVLIMPVKVLDEKVNNYIYSDNGRRKLVTDVIADGIIFSVKNKADVINLSLGFPGLVETGRMRDAIAYAKANDVAIVAAAGNNNKEIPIYPCTYEDVICVGSFGVDGEYSEFSNFGGKVDILAPGDQIVSTYPSADVESDILRIKGYESLKGTSQSAPFIASILANMRLLDPRITVDEMKAKLYSSANEIKQSKKFSKFGRASMKKALAAEPKTFIMPSFKSLLDIKYDSATKGFNFTVPIKNLLGTTKNVNIKVELESEAVKLTNDSLSIERFGAGDSHALEVTGEVIDEMADNNVKLNLIITAENFEQKTSTTLMFARKVPEENFMTVDNARFEKMAHIARRRSFFTGFFISDPHRLLADPIAYTDTKEGDDITVDLLHINTNDLKQSQLVLKNYNQLLGIFANDTNLDGQADLFVYGMDVERKNLIFEFLNLEGKALIKHNRWLFPLSEFEGLPITRTRKELFHWLKTKTPWGEMLLPAIYKHYETPEVDKSDDFLDETPSTKRRFHLYYFEPMVQGNTVSTRLRVVNSDSFIDDLIEEHNLPWNELIHLEQPLKQTNAQRKAGIIQGMISVGQQTNKKYFRLNLNTSRRLRVESFGPRNDISNNTLVDIYDDGGSIMGSGYIRRNNKRNSLRIGLGDIGEENISFSTDNWADPVFDVIAGYNGEQFFINSRYFIHALTKDGSYTLPINRDSTFEEAQFSESFIPIITEIDNKTYPALYMDSTMIFGDRLYTMVLKDNTFRRPFRSSIGIPAGCANMEPMQLKGEKHFSYLLICKRQDKLEVGIVPIK